MSTTHLCPRTDGAYTRCCGKSPFDLPRTDRLTVHEDQCDCPGSEVVEVSIPEEWRHPGLRLEGL